MSAQKGTLIVVATPLGNLGDLSPRASEALQTAHVVFAEDTRVTETLLRHVGSHARCVSLHAHNERDRTQAVLDALAAGERAALVSDAGTPLVSDPGAHVVAAAASAGYAVTSVPGPSAVVTALAASGFLAVPFAFFGFVERKGEAQTRQLAAMRQFSGTIVVFETKERIHDTLGLLAEMLGEGTPALIGRELTKLHETYYRGTLAELAAELADTTLKGEMTLVVAPRAAAHQGLEDRDAVVRELQADASRPLPVRVKELVLRTGMTRKDAYRALSEAKSE
ncbi:MAG: 16S rRNA (cytidine(1402)-2'-O)-methyltransferase [Deltaproteobacteria bacterium]|nr:16S rRNA (cytidine(1402)-2'-O)-methyltransferase [Deltaproteobacteria bacterium]